MNQDNQNSRQIQINTKNLILPSQAKQYIRSYVNHCKRISKAQRQALNNFSDEFIVPINDIEYNWSKIFCKNAPLKLEIGFGMGEATAKIAEIETSTNFIAVDIYKPGIGALINRLKKQNIKNVKLVTHDAIDVLTTMISDGSLDAIHIFFPDPWPKQKHQKRRLIQPDLVALFAKKVHPGGYIYCATDWPPYATHISNIFNENLFFTKNNLPYSLKPSDRPQTKFELRGINLGQYTQDLIFYRK